jgi:hypothetical protein
MILREILATLLLQQGTHSKIVSERLGHANISMTLDIYSHVLPNMQLEAVRKLEDIFDYFFTSATNWPQPHISHKNINPANTHVYRVLILFWSE